MMKRILSFMLALLLVVSAIPVRTFAEDGAVEPAAQTCTKCDDPACDGSHPDWCDICKLDNCGKTHTFCETCQKYDCGKTHIFCETCQKYDCGKTHTFCETCQKYDCGKTHTFCETCQKYDCGKTHTFCETCQKYDCSETHTTPAPQPETDSCTKCDDPACDGSHPDWCDICKADNCGKEHKTCDKCKTVDCTADHTNWCDICKADNCGKTHTFCETCQKYDCGKTHTTPAPQLETDSCTKCDDPACDGSHPDWCDICKADNCGKEHKTCDKCEAVDCTADHTNWCDICKADNCGKTHTFCETCQKYDCGKIHIAALPRISMTSIGPAASVSEGGEETPDYSADIGKYVKLNKGATAFTVEGINPASNRAEIQTFLHEDFQTGTIFRIADWKVEQEQLWYRLTFYKGGMNDESDYAELFPVEPWFKQTTAKELVFMDTCSVCGKPDCTGHTWCDICEAYDCGKDHTQPECGCCENCTGTEDCECGCGNCDFFTPADPEVPELKDDASGVIVLGNSFPAGMKLSVYKTDVSSQLGQFGVPASNLAFGLDITLLDAENAVTQPNGTVRVKVPVDAASGTTIGILHTHGNKTTCIDLTEVLSDGTVEFTTDSFSTFAGFTVDFDYNGIEYSIEGLTSITLSELFPILEIERDAAHVIDVTFTDPTLISVTKLDGDWQLTSLQAFDTTEELKIFFADGEVIKIVVTDEQKGTYGQQTTDDPVCYKEEPYGLGKMHTMQLFGTLYNSGVIAHLSHWGGITKITFKLHHVDGKTYTSNKVPSQASVQFSFSGDYWYLVQSNDGWAGLANGDGLNNIRFTDVWGSGAVLDFYSYSRITYNNPNLCTVKQRSILAEDTGDDYISRRVYIYLNGSLISSESYKFPPRGGTSTDYIEVSNYDSNKYSVTKEVSGNDYVVRLREKYTVTWKNGDTVMKKDTVLHGDNVTYSGSAPSKPTANGYAYTFTGWDKGSTLKNVTASTTVNAQFSSAPVTYTATFSANSGSVSPSSSTYNVERKLTLPTPTRNGHYFNGWKVTTPDGNWTNGSTFAAGTVEKGKFGNVTFTAQWVPIYKVTLDAQNSATDSKGTQAYWYIYQTTKVVNGETVYYWTNDTCTTPLAQYKITKPTKVGYTFSGYYTAKNGGGTKYVNEEGVCVGNLYQNVAANSTLYAYWIPNIYKVTLHDQGATTAGTNTYWYRYQTTNLVDGETVYYWTDAACTAPLHNYRITVPQKTGYSFAGYFTAENGSGTQYVAANGECINNLYSAVADDSDLYAKWNYTVNYNANDGTGTIASQTQVERNSVTLSNGTGFSRVGYTLSGWNTATDGSGTPYDKGASYTDTGSGSVTLYAQWEADTDTPYTLEIYTQNIEDDDYTKVFQTLEGTTDETVTVTPDERTGFTYNASRSTVSGKVAGDGSLVLKVYYDRNKYNVTFKNEDGTNLQSSDVKYGATPVYSGATPTKAADAQYTYTHSGWTPAITAVTGNATYTATYTGTVNNYEVQVSLNSDQVTYTGLDGFTVVDGKLEKTVPYDTQITASFTAKEGYDIEEVLIDNVKQSGTTITLNVTGNHHIEVKSSPKTYNITWMTDATTEYTKTTATFGTAITLPDAPTMAGYEFTGWTPAIPETMPAKDLTFTAQWVATTRKLTYAYTNVDVSKFPELPAAEDVNVGELVTVFVPSNVEGYTFSGWSSDDVTIADGEFTMPEKDVTLTGNWTLDTYTITYNLAGGEPPEGISPNEQSYNIEQEFTLMEEPTREGWKFTGWELDKPQGATDNWEETHYTAGQNVGPGKHGDVTLVAQWEEQYRYVLKFNANGGTTTLETMTKEWCDDAEWTFTWDKTNNPTLTGYTFKGWAAEADSTTVVTNGDHNSYKITGTAAATEEKTLYAIWERNTGTLELDYSGDSAPVIVTISCTESEGGNASELITIRTVITGDSTVTDLPTGTYNVTAKPGRGNYTASASLDENQLGKGKTITANVTTGTKDNNWLTDFDRQVNRYS